MRNSKRTGPGGRWGHSFILIGLMLALTAVVAMCVSTEPTEEPEQTPEPLVIETVRPCTQGRVTVYQGNEVLYQYGGEIDIANDGTDGKEIEIVVEYPEDWGWPCSCFSEEDMNEQQ